MANSIVVVHSFRCMENTCIGEPGKTYWFSTEQKANEYLERAGRRITEGYYYDDPCEHRWNYVVVERVFEGAGSTNEVLSWWKAKYENGRLAGLFRSEPPFNPEGYFNFTGVGT